MSARQQTTSAHSSNSFPNSPSTQAEIDSCLAEFRSLPDIEQYRQLQQLRDLELATDTSATTKSAVGSGPGPSISTSPRPSESSEADPLTTWDPSAAREVNEWMVKFMLDRQGRPSVLEAIGEYLRMVQDKLLSDGMKDEDMEPFRSDFIRRYRYAAWRFKLEKKKLNDENERKARWL
ncbi:MAG: hypothetical protein M1820_001868 [Bogoriella megaspora]|nr:MAG: hypothetical protein M1820_001868 [Bogoriella megaspora]